MQGAELLFEFLDLLALRVDRAFELLQFAGDAGAVGDMFFGRDETCCGFCAY